MKVTMYELLGMVKDGKMPKKIKYRQNIFEFIHGLGDYKPDDIKKYHGNYLFHYLFEEEVNFLNDEVEILDNGDEEKGLPKKINVEQDENGRIDGIYMSRQEIDERNKINEIIDYLKKQSKGE